jgi:rSAM/selenodomain-associated transferase 2
VAEPSTDTPRLSIVIPVLDEADCLDRSLSNLFSRPGFRAFCEVIVSDGGSTDRSLEIAARYPCRIVTGDAGRALQMNAATVHARGDWLLFLHADSRLPEDFERLVDGDWGFFRLRLDGEHPAFRVIETMINLRSRLSRVAGGDQGLFFRRGFFESLGGFARIPLMEDIAICKQARRRGAPRIIDAAMNSSSRRWQQRGIAKTVLLMWSLRFAYWLGIDPGRLHRYYYPERG